MRKLIRLIATIGGLIGFGNAVYKLVGAINRAKLNGEIDDYVDKMLDGFNGCISSIKSECICRNNCIKGKKDISNLNAESESINSEERINSEESAKKEVKIANKEVISAIVGGKIRKNRGTRNR